ncbi:MAG: hypothetical protein C0467_00480 [Planctomycetaceae bacterium]|nr:hypothetical protein [Planctomycetaceae bacterium]
MTAKLLTASILLIGLMWTTGCDKKAAPTSAKPDEKKHKDDDHDHAHGAGPHKGTIFDFGGGKWHGEFTADHDKKEVTVWILGLDEKTAAPIKAEKLRLVVSNIDPKIEIDLIPADKAADGSAHSFTGKHDGFAKPQEYKGTVSFQVAGKQYSGDFEEKPEKK